MIDIHSDLQILYVSRTLGELSNLPLTNLCACQFTGFSTQGKFSKSHYFHEAVFLQAKHHLEKDLACMKGQGESWSFFNF